MKGTEQAEEMAVTQLLSNEAAARTSDHNNSLELIEFYREMADN